MRSRGKSWAGNWIGSDLSGAIAHGGVGESDRRTKAAVGDRASFDRGVQYASNAYVGLLRKHDMIPSMSRPANPYDNASCESFLKALKREEIYANEYRDLEHLGENLAAFIDNYYNRVRLHSALGYQPPEEFEQVTTAAAKSKGASMSFFRHEEIFRSDRGLKPEGEPAETSSPDHRFDESSAGYSSAGWSPPEPASASPTDDQSEGNTVV